MRTHLQIEREEGYPRLRVAGVDEVGRGCIAGPVVAGAVLLPPLDSAFDLQTDPWLSEIADSKLLSPMARERLAPQLSQWLREKGGSSGIGSATVEEIDALNIFHAAHLAMTRAVDAAAQSAGVALSQLHVIVDGKFLPRNWGVARARAVIRGDLQCFSIAAASILAKVHRDAEMVDADVLHPGYGLSVHKGYGTPAHLRSLQERGPTVLHRKSFAPVRAALHLNP